VKGEGQKNHSQKKQEENTSEKLKKWKRIYKEEEKPDHKKKG